MDDLFIYDKEFTKKYVLAESCALIRDGLIHGNPTSLGLQTQFEELDGVRTGISSFHYNPQIDYDYKLTPMKSNPLLLKPTKERALVECILHLDWVDEGLLIEGLKNYITQFWDEKELYEVADHFNLSHDTLEYWLEEARNDYDE